MWGFFFLCCVWINGFYSLLDFRVAFTSANLVHILSPQHLLYAYSHTSIYVKSVSPDSCTEVLCEWAGICFSCDYRLVLCSSFLLTSLHPDENRCLCVWVCCHECLRSAQFSSTVKRLKSTSCHTIATEGKVCFYWAFRFHWSQAWNLYGLANLQSSCLWLAIRVWHTCTTWKNCLFSVRTRGLCPLS